MKFTKVDGKYYTEEGRYEIAQDWTSAPGSVRLVRCWIVYNHSIRIKTCRTLGEAKEYVKLLYC